MEQNTTKEFELLLQTAIVKKWCWNCQEDKPLSQFHNNAGRYDGLQSQCKSCCFKTTKVHRQKHHKHYRAYYADRRSYNRQAIGRLKEATPCMDCKRYFPACVMDFDHKSNKKHNISRMMDYSWQAILDEIAQCELVCANCHRIRTERRKLNT